MLFKAVILFFSLLNFARAEEYYVNPIICRSKSIPNPLIESTIDSGFKIISVKMSNSQNCNLENKTLTIPLFGESLKSASLTDEHDGSSLGGAWTGNPLEKNGDIVLAPFGLWGTSVMLNIKKNKIEGTTRIDTLTGFADSLAGNEGNSGYDYFECEARVVSEPVKIGTSPSSCSPQ